MQAVGEEVLRFRRIYARSPARLRSRRRSRDGAAAQELRGPKIPCRECRPAGREGRAHQRDMAIRQRSDESPTHCVAAMFAAPCQIVIGASSGRFPAEDTCSRLL